MQEAAATDATSDTNRWVPHDIESCISFLPHRLFRARLLSHLISLLAELNAAPRVGGLMSGRRKNIDRQRMDGSFDDIARLLRRRSNTWVEGILAAI